MICWSCERAAGDGATCSACGALLPPDAAADYFQVMGVPPRYALDLSDAESRFRELSRRFHPDKFARADPRARRASLQRSVQLNQAWRTLKDPVRRAEYLLRLAGHPIDDEDVSASPALLGEILELRETLGEARADDDDPRVQAMAAGVRGRAEAALARVAAGLARAEDDPAAGADVRDEVARELIAIRYFRRFLDEVAIHDEAVATHREAATDG